MNRHEWEQQLDRLRAGELRPEGLAVLLQYADSAFEREELLCAMKRGYAINYQLVQIAKAMRRKKQPEDAEDAEMV